MSIYVLVRGGWEYQENIFVSKNLIDIENKLTDVLTPYYEYEKEISNPTEREDGSFIINSWRGKYGEYVHIEEWKV